MLEFEEVEPTRRFIFGEGPLGIVDDLLGVEDDAVSYSASSSPSLLSFPLPVLLKTSLLVGEKMDKIIPGWKICQSTVLPPK